MKATTRTGRGNRRAEEMPNFTNDDTIIRASTYDMHPCAIKTEATTGGGGGKTKPGLAVQKATESKAPTRYVLFCYF